MGEVLFYHLSTVPLERSLPELLIKSLSRGWNVVVRAGSEARLAMVDDMLWTYDDMSFLPHGRRGMGQEEMQPVYLTTDKENPAAAKVLMLVEGGRVDCEEAGDYDRICLMFNGNEPEDLTCARSDWKAVTEAGLTARYWAQEGGTWVQKASSGEQ